MKFVVSGLVAFCVAVMAALVAGFVARGLGPATAWGSLICGIVIGGFAWRSMSKTPFDRCPPVSGWAEWCVVSAFALFALRCFCWLIFRKDEDVGFLSSNNLGDLSLHLTYTNYLANGAPFWPENPIYAGAGLHYPFGVDLFNSLLVLAGVDIVRGLVWVGLLGALAAGVTLWRWGGAFTMAGFLSNGGIAGFAIFQTFHWQGHHLDFHLEDFQDHYAWKSIPLALFVTQRGLLYAIPAGLALLWSWRERLLRKGRGLPVWVEVLLYATMPVFHLHTFIFLSVMLAWWFLLGITGYWGQEPTMEENAILVPFRNFRFPNFQISTLSSEVLRIVGLALVPATAMVWMLTDGFRSGNSIHWRPGWMQDGENPLVFWFENFGFLPLAVAWLFFWLSTRRKDPATAAETAEQGAVVGPAVLIFFIACFVMFAPWEWDNTKLMIWCYLVVLPALWAMLAKFNVWIRAVACFALFFSGFVSLLGGIDSSHQGYPLASRQELDGLAGPLRAFPVNATFACYPTYNHPLLLLGHKVVAGYEGHLMSHGIDYRGRVAELESLLRGEPGWENRVRELGVDYLFWGSREQKEFGTSTTPWKDRAPVALRSEWGTIYDLRPMEVRAGSSVGKAGR